MKSGKDIMPQVIVPNTYS